jgi:hypothetical protein
MEATMFETLAGIETPITRVDLKKRGDTYTLVTHTAEGISIRPLGKDLHAALDEWNRVAEVAAQQTH